MQPYDRTAKNAALRYGLTLGLLMLIVGGIAWMVQYLPSRGPQVSPNKVEATDKKLLTFVRDVAQWGTKAEDEDKQSSPKYKDLEPLTKGYYDFLFENDFGQAVVVDQYWSSCSCTSVKVGLLPPEEWERVHKVHRETPGEPLPYAKELEWLALTSSHAPGHEANKENQLVKAGEKGVIRVEWSTRETVGQILDVRPTVMFYPVDNPTRKEGRRLIVPIMVTAVVQFEPARLHVGVLSADRPARAQFRVWSTTRDSLEVKPLLTFPDPLFAFAIKPLSAKECADFEAGKKLTSHVRCAYQVSVTVHESKDGKYLDQGSFYRKTVFALDGNPVNPDAPLYGPEIVGRVDGGILIGGAENPGKIVFPSFSAKNGASQEVQLASDAKVELQKFDNHPDQPRWIKVHLTREPKQSSSSRTTWLLEVVVPPNAPGAASFDEPNAVVLKIAGTPERLVRIPIEGHISR